MLYLQCKDIIAQINLINVTQMNSQMNRIAPEEKVQVYRNDFFSGIVLLTKKLFML